MIFDAKGIHDELVARDRHHWLNGWDRLEVWLHGALWGVIAFVVMLIVTF